MGKRRSRGRASAEGTPMQSDISDVEISTKKSKKDAKTSADICEELHMENVVLEFTEADYQNLTTFSLFSRLFRPQVVSVNSKTSSSKIIQVMEAKWKEFGRAKVAADVRRKEEAVRKEAEEQAAKEKETTREDEVEEDMEEDVEEHEDEDAASDVAEDEFEEVEDDDEEEEEMKTPSTSRPRKSVGTLRIKMPMIALRKSNRDRKQKNYNEDPGSDSTASSIQVAKRRRIKPQDSDNDATSSQDVTGESDQEDSFDDDTDSSDSDASSDTGRRRRNKDKKSYKPHIPGERKSDRKHKDMSKTVSDREFERILKQEEEEKEAKIRRRERNKRKVERQRQRQMEKTRKGYWQDDDPNRVEDKDDKDEKDDSRNDKEDDDGNESDHFWYCEICKDGGDLLLCDTCPKSFHMDCLRIQDVPDGDWSCPLCSGEGLPEEDDSGVEHEQFCKVCHDGGDVILCDFCPCVFHMRCVNPPLKDIPDGDWECDRCQMAKMKTKGKIKLLLTWRWSHQLKGADELDHTHSPTKKVKPTTIEITDDTDSKESTELEARPTREIFVKYEYHSYWDCEWIPELMLEIHYPHRWNWFKRKFDMDEPPALEDGSSYGKVRHKDVTDKDPYKLEEMYYRYNIKPEWLAIQRIIAHEGKGRDLKYLVKWQDLAYEECTWEYPGEVHKALEDDFRRHIDLYWERRKEKTQESRKKKDKPKKSMMKKKYAEQPDYISACGGKLHPYQLEGFNWIRFSYAQDTNTILADEMGLGKTIQTIVFLQSLFREGHSPGPFLISAPLSTVPNWEREFAFWAPELYVVTYSGHKESRMVIRERDFCYKDGAFAMLAKPSRMREGFKPKFDVLLTSYEAVNMDMATLSSIDWEVLVIDEAHRLKNNQSLYFQTMSSYKIKYKLLLTGTPLQNNLEELFNLLNFLEPEKFRDQDDFLTEFDNISKDLQVERLHEMLAPHMLRRLKADVLGDIPDKIELIVRIELAPMQKTFYKHILTKNFEALNVRGLSNQTSLMNIMMDLRKCCNHPYMFPTAHQDAPITKTGLYEGTALTKACGKLVLLEKMLKVLKRDNHRVLIFSQMTRCIDILEDFLEHLGHKYERLDGSVSSTKRQESIDRFNSLESEQFVFLLSTKAGGLGINLATADTVIIYDMDWNPHNDIQAFSRAHRIGQKNKVMIYRFVSRSTVEERMAQVCKRKMMLTELVIHRGMNSEKTDSLNKKEVSDILKYGAEELFKDDEGKGITYDDEAVEKLLDRAQDGEIQRESGMNDYLRTFRVASYQVKQTEEVPEEVEDTATSTSFAHQDKEEDRAYWGKVLGESHIEFTEQQIREQEAIARTLGKGKRVRRRINYAEKQAMLELDAKGQQSEKDLEARIKKGREKVVEEATYLSDYEPSSSSSSEDEEWEESAEKELKEIGVSKPPTKKSAKKLDEVSKSKELPPLMARVNGHVEVLGFTARQRRAFLDVVMKFGLPPEDAYNSQWRARDLRDKAQKVFKAYSSLFMRHLCEPVSDSTTVFSDGIPWEGLSRQHVLTRIGMIALIRKKVAEFEKVNGIDSMANFDVGLRPVSGFRRGMLAKPSVEKNPEAEELLRLIQGRKSDIETDKTDPASETAAVKESSATTSDNVNDKDSKDESKAESTSKDTLPSNENSPSKDKTVDVEPASNSESGTEHSNETSSKESTSKHDECSAAVDMNAKKESPSKVKGEVDKEAEEVETSVVASSEVVPMEAESSLPKKEIQEEDTDITMKDVPKVSVENKADEMEEEEVAESREEQSESTMNKNVNDGKEPKSEDSEEVKPSVTDEDSKTTKDHMQMSTMEQAEKDKSAVKAPFKPLTYPELAKELRKKFWIADGGFTELHALWQLEESTMDQKKPYQTWHRIHDFWLLTGIVTHGYRHWQDIINDARFEVLNHVFRTDDARMKKAAFLNRRFQVLEQALVIEEQLHKAVKRNHGLPPSLQEPQDYKDHLTALDKMASHLRKVNQSKNKGSVDKRSVKALNQVGSLVQDIKQSTANAFSASLVKPPQQASGSSSTSLIKPPQQAMQMARPGVGMAERSIVKKTAAPHSGANMSKFVSQMLAEKKSQQQPEKLPGKDVICLD